MRTHALRALLLFTSLATASAFAAPVRGQAFPLSAARDLNGQLHSPVLRPGAKNLVVVMTARGAGDAAQAWFDTADSRMPAHVHRVSLISLRLPFFVGDGMVRGKARQRVPAQYWTASFIDKDAEMAKVLQLPKSDEPWVFVVDPHGRVLASVHGLPTAPQAEEIWSAVR